MTHPEDIGDVQYDEWRDRAAERKAPPCGCRIRILPPETGRAYVLNAEYIQPSIGTIEYCPLHAHAEAMREVLRRCAEGAFLMEQRGKLINLAQQVLAKIEVEA